MRLGLRMHVISPLPVVIHELPRGLSNKARHDHAVELFSFSPFNILEKKTPDLIS